MIVAIFHIFGDQIFDLWVKMPSFLDLVEMRASAKWPLQRDSQNERKQICLGNYRPPGALIASCIDLIEFLCRKPRVIPLAGRDESTRLWKTQRQWRPIWPLASQNSGWDEINRNDHRVQMEPMTDTGNVVVSVLAMNSNERLHLAMGFNDRDQ